MGFLQFLEGAKRQVDIFDSNKTYKNKKGNPNDKRSTVRQITDAGKGLAVATAAPFTYLAKADIINPAKELAADITGNEVAGRNARRQSAIDLGLGPEGKDLAGGFRKWAGNSAQVGLTFLAPAASKLIAPVTEKAGGGVASSILNASGTGAVLGAPFGASAAVADTENPLSVENILKGAGYGVAGGALLGAAGEAAHLAIHNRRPLNQVGAVGRNVSDDEIKKLAASDSTDAIKKSLAEIVPPEKLEATSLAIQVTKDPNRIRDIIHNATPSIESPHAERLVKDYADALREFDQTVNGGQMQKTESGYIRTSEHSQFFRNFYKENGRAPTKSDWYEEAHNQLLNGRADPYAQREYDALNNPEVISLLNQGPEYYGADTTVGNELPAQIPAKIPQEPRIAGEKDRGFLKSAQESPQVAPDAKKALSEVDPQTYHQKPNKELVSKATEYVDKNPDEAMSHVLSDANGLAELDQHVAMGIQLIHKYRKMGDTEKTVRIVERLDTKLRDAGRGVQAASLIDNLSPEGILVYAQRKVRKAREGHTNYSQEKPTSQAIQKEVEGFAPEDKGVVQKAVQDTVEELTTGGKVAKGVEKAASPVQKQKTDELVKELVKKVKQESLAPRTNTQKSPIDTLREVFGRNEEAQAAYPEAQQILREKFAGDEKMTAALDDFFGSSLGKVPAAESTINRAIQEQLKTNKVSVMKAIYKSWANQRQTVGDVTEALVKEGFDEKSAAVLAKEVTSRLNKQFAGAKAKTLERLAREAPEHLQPTYIEKVSKLSNLGALDSADYIDLARAKLGLPNLKGETAKQLSDLAQYVQTLPEGADKYAAIRQMKQLIESETPMTKKQMAGQAIATPRALMASSDLSFGGRQAIAYATAHPIKFAQQWHKQFKYFKEAFAGDESRAFDELMGEIQSHKDYKLLEKSDLAITDPFGISPNAREEQFLGSHYAESIPGAGRLVRASNYAFTGLANSLRANEFYAQISHAREAGIPLTQKLVNDLAEVINTGTGRGTVKALEPHMKTLSTALFAPRLIASRVQMFNPYRYWKLEPLARKEALRQLMSLSAFGVGILTMAKAAGADVGVDPRSSDFGKVKIGDTRLDFFGGHTQYIRLGYQLAPFVGGETVSSLSGRTSTLGTGYGKKSRKDIIQKFLENKANPVVSFATTMIAGQDAVGNPIDSPQAAGKEVISRFLPLVYQDVADMATHKGVNPLIGGPLAIAGVGTQTYGKQDIKLSEKQQAYVDNLEKTGASKEKIAATKDFYQTLKTTPDRQAASDKVNAALKAGDYEEARTIAKDYNKQYAAVFKQWAKKYGSQEDATLRKEYNSKKLILDSGSIRTRLKNIRKNNLTSAVLGGN